jgi:short-subunit dehydrogenase
VARSHNALIALKEELESAHGISATVIVADLAVPGAAQKVFAATEGAGLHIKNLVNNAGVGGHGKFHERDLASDEAMMQAVYKGRHHQDQRALTEFRIGGASVTTFVSRTVRRSDN